MKYYDMVTIPDLGSKAVFESIKNAEDIVLKEEPWITTNEKGSVSPSILQSWE